MQLAMYRCGALRYVVARIVLPVMGQQVAASRQLHSTKSVDRRNAFMTVRRIIVIADVCLVVFVTAP